MIVKTGCGTDGLFYSTSLPWPARATTVINIPVEGGGGLYIDPVVSLYLQQVLGNSIAKVNEIKTTWWCNTFAFSFTDVQVWSGHVLTLNRYTYKINSLSYITSKKQSSCIFFNRYRKACLAKFKLGLTFELKMFWFPNSSPLSDERWHVFAAGDSTSRHCTQPDLKIVPAAEHICPAATSGDVVWSATGYLDSRYLDTSAQISN